MGVFVVAGCLVFEGDYVSAFVFESPAAAIEPGVSFYVCWEVV
jgi:hypothetical protein